MDSTTQQTPQGPREHRYHAEAGTLFGRFVAPIAQPVRSQAQVKLGERGGYLYERAERYQAQGLLSYGSAYAQVAGHDNPKPSGGWLTLATSVIEDLNIMQVVTADRIVAQVSLHHPKVGYVPTVTFLGTRFENLRIAGHPVEVSLSTAKLGTGSPTARYMSDRATAERAARLLGQIQQASGLNEEVAARFSADRTRLAEHESVEWSLAERVATSGGNVCGHVIEVPDFGRICIGALRVYQPLEAGVCRRTTVELTMLDIHMGCIGDGTAKVGEAKLNGQSNP